MNENELIREALALLERGSIEAAEARFGEYLWKRVQVGDPASVENMWKSCVAEKQSQMAEQERIKQEEAERQRQQGGKLRRWICGAK